MDEKNSAVKSLAVIENAPGNKMSIEELKTYLKGLYNIKNLPPEEKKKIIQTYVSI